jgi:signal transduction histidine kinase
VTEELATLRVRDLPGVFALRGLGRQLAAGLGLEHQDQVRVATALSEISRSAVTEGQTAEVVFGADAGNLLLTVTVSGKPHPEGVTAASRLLDTAQADGNVIRMTKRRPASPAVDLSAVRERLAALNPESTLDELRRHNEDLIATLEDLRQQKEQLVLLNAELQETNRGVMALYRELSEELEQTNRGVVALYRELDEKSEQLRAASESKNRFWANVSHELRTPLNSIIGLTRLLDEPDSGLGAEQRHQVGLISNATSGLLTLVNDLLDVAKAESGQLDLDPAAVSLPSLLATLRGLIKPMAEDKPVEVTVSADGAPATVLTDEAALTAILRNLLSNAVKYTDAGEVRLTVRTIAGPAGAGPAGAGPAGAGPAGAGPAGAGPAGAGRIEIEVTDTGTGIPDGQLERVFEEFYQVPGVRRGGTGLGLPYARRLSRLLGGELRLTSEPGQGTTAVLSLPHGIPRLAAVVVADDDPAYREIVTSLLAGIADRIIPAADGAQALAAVAGEPVDLVLADLSMPGVDGYALLERLPPDLPAITGRDVVTPPRAAALLRKDQLTWERLVFAIRRAGPGLR